MKLRFGVLVVFYSCVSVSDPRGTVKIVLTERVAQVIGYWKKGQVDVGYRAKDSKSGQAAYKGFELWVDDGVPGSGRLYINRDLLTDGSGFAFLSNLYQEDESATPRTDKLKCGKVN